MKKIDHIKYRSLDEFKKKSFFRQNILKWYPFDKNSTFLHINGEDGILSKYLSTFGKVFYLSDNLLDLEGLQKFCPGVKIINESVDGYLSKSDSKFDYILIEGYLDIIQNKKQILELCIQHLNKKGKIIVLADNKLGLRYFSGARLDSKGRLFSNILESNELFTKDEWDSLCKEVGLPYKFFFPYPNYQFPEYIFSQTPNVEDIKMRDSSFEYKRLQLFEESTALKEMIRCGEYERFCDSFFIVLNEIDDYDIDYVKFAVERKKEYQIYTVIPKSRRYVIKYPYSLEAMNHLKKMYKYYLDFNKNNFDSSLSYCKSYLMEDSIGFDFVKGVSLEKKISDEVNDDIKYIQEKIDIINRFLNVSEECQFIRTEKFVEIFGDNDYSILISEPSVQGANIDLIFDNIIDNDKKYYVIDYEWIIDTVIPKSFVVYRALLHSEAISHIDERKRKDIYKINNISEELQSLYLKMEQNFQLYVSNCKILDTAKELGYSQKFYIDDNSAFQLSIQNGEFKTVHCLGEENHIVLQIPVKNRRKIRLSFNRKVILHINDILMNNNSVDYLYSNADIINHSNYYFREEPIIDIPNDTIGILSIDLKIIYQENLDKEEFLTIVNQMEKIMELEMQSKGLTYYPRNKQLLEDHYDVSIVIPTKNGGNRFDEVLTMIDCQKTQYTYEVICVDSGSSDNTIDIIKKHHCILKQIPKEEFGHGKTRNLGASLGSGDYIIFITQDAKPYDKFWIENFINGMKSDPEIVGGFGKHYPYPECNLFDKRNLYYHFKGFGEKNTVYYLEDKERYKNDEGYRHMLAFYSDNNSCMRRDIWEKYPYDDVDFAEDQIWARKMIELGYKKLYCENAAVYHSHNYPLKTYKERYFDEYKGLYRLHHYVMVHTKKELIRGYLRMLKNDLAFVKNAKLSKKQKIYWAYYATRRDWYQFYSAYYAGKYYNLPEKEQKKLDMKLSQQLRQRNQ